jgi:hypothetical protein
MHPPLTVGLLVADPDFQFVHLGHRDLPLFASR